MYYGESFKEFIVTDEVIQQVLALMLMMAVGWGLKKKGILTNLVNRSLSDILINVTMPCLIIKSFNVSFSSSLMVNAWNILMYSFIIHALMIGFCQVWYCKVHIIKKSIFHFATVFSNCAFIGYPLTHGLFGEIGVFYTSMFLIPFNLLVFTYGVMLFTGKAGVKSLVRDLVLNIPLISTFAGILIFVLNIKIPAFCLGPLTSVGNMTTPISMFVIGSMLADAKVQDVFAGLDIYYLSLIKLIVAPLLCYLLISRFIADQTLLKILVILVAMPTATLVGIFAEKYDGNRHAASLCVFITTALSMITIPVITAMI